MRKNNRFVPIHLEQLKSCLESKEAWAGNNLKLWHEQVDSSIQSNLPSERVDRSQLKALCLNETYTTRECVAAILAWGGMHRAHARRFFSSYQLIEKTAEGLRDGTLRPDRAYESFKNITKTKPIGIGPAYYTKLIFFLEPNHKGYIMDQWTAKSINLLRGENVVRTTKKGLVTPTNNVTEYRNFRAEITHLSQYFGIPTEVIETLLFSIGGRNKGSWRQHVVDHWQPIPAAETRARI